jgi:hypothetical protein
MLPILSLRELDLTQTEAKRPREERGDGPDEVGEEEDEGEEDEDEDEELTKSMRILKGDGLFAERKAAFLARAWRLLEDVDRGGPSDDSGGQFNQADEYEWLEEVIEAAKFVISKYEDSTDLAVRAVLAAAQRLMNPSKPSADEVGFDDAEMDVGAGNVNEVVGEETAEEAAEEAEEVEVGEEEAEEAAEEVVEAAPGGAPLDETEVAEAAEAGEAAGRGADPSAPEDGSAPRIVGRASEKGPRGGELHYYLVLTPGRRQPKRARSWAWLRRDELTTPDLQSAFDALPLERQGTDPTGDGWVIKVSDGRDGPNGREYRLTWFTWNEGERAPVSKRLEWRRYEDMINQTLATAYDGTVRREAGLAEEESDDDDEEVGPMPAFLYETQLDANDPTRTAPSSVRWDPSLGRPRLSLRAAVRNHQAGDYTVAALRSYVLQRRLVLLSRVPPKPDAAGAPSEEELTQLGEDLLFVHEPKLLAQWRRSRLLVARRRREAEDADDADDADEDEEQSEAEAEAAWRVRTRATLLDQARARWRASWEAVDAELDELQSQWRALELIGGDDDVGAEAERVQVLVRAWREEEDWPRYFAAPRLKSCQISDYLSEGRSQVAERWLLLQRRAHTEAPDRERSNGIMGSSLGGSWPFDEAPSPSEAPGEHTVPVEWYSPSALLILEQADGRQCPVGIHISLQTENSSKGSKPLSIFGLASERDTKQTYVPSLLPEAKRAQLAKSTAFGFLTYLGLSNKQTSKGASSLATSTGVAVYARAWTNNGAFRRLINQAATPWERRMQLLCLGIQGWQVGNPLVLHSLAFDDEAARLFAERIGGSDPLLKLADAALRDSVLQAP